MLRTFALRTTIPGTQRPFRAITRFGTCRWGRFIHPSLWDPAVIRTHLSLEAAGSLLAPRMGALYRCGPRLWRLLHPPRGEGRGPLYNGAPVPLWSPRRAFAMIRRAVAGGGNHSVHGRPFPGFGPCNAGNNVGARAPASVLGKSRKRYRKYPDAGFSLVPGFRRR